MGELARGPRGRDRRPGGVACAGWTRSGPSGAGAAPRPAAMGVKQLWKELEARGALRKLAGGSHHAELAAELEGKVVAIDLAIWAAQCSDQVYASQELNHAQKAAKLALERATMLLQYGVVPLGVVEGVPPALKAAAIERRNAAFYGAESASRGGAHTGMKSITRGMGKVFRALGLPVVEAPSEAEAMCCALVEVGLADAVATEDGDALIYKAKKCYRYDFDVGRKVPSVGLADD